MWLSVSGQLSATGGVGVGGCRGAAGPLGHRTAGMRLQRASTSGTLRCLALSGLIKALRRG